MKMIRNLIILVAVMGALIGSYFIFKNIKPKTVKNNTNVQNKTISIYQVDSSKIKEIKIVNSKATLTFYPSGKTWKIREAPDAKLDQTKVSDPASNFSSLVAEQIVDSNPTDLSKYGLEKPSASATVLLNDGTSKTFLLGNMNTSSDYYFMEKGVNKVYTVIQGIGDDMNYTIDKLWDISLPGITDTDITYFKLQEKDKSPIEVTYSTTNQYGISSWYMNQPYAKDADSQSVKDLNTKLAALKLTAFITDKPANLADYGLDKPALVLEVKDKNKNDLKLSIGNLKDNLYYCSVGDSKTVYTIDKSLLDFINIEPFSLVDKFAYLINLDNVDKFTIDSKLGSDTLSITRSKTKNSNGDYDATYFLNGKKVTDKQFKTFYQDVIGLSVDGDYTGSKLTSKADVTITYALNKAPNKTTMEFISYDLDHYAVYINGKSQFYINKDKLDGMLDVLSQFKQGKFNPTD